MKTEYYVRVLKGSYEGHEDANPTPKKYPKYDYVVGPFKTRKEAEERARTEKNLTGTFTDPFCNNGQGR